MPTAAFAVLAALAIAVRVTYPRILERRERRRLPVGSDGIVPGGGAIDLPRENAPGVLLLHGCGDTPQVLAALAEYLYGRGLSVRAPLLSGHGCQLPALATASAAAWHEEVRRDFESMRATHDAVALVGLSMGAALAVKLASERDDIPALVLLVPYLAMPTAVRGMAATSALWGWTLPYFSSGGRQSIRDPAAAARALGRGILTPPALRALYEVMTQAVRALPLVRAPALVIHSAEDNRIPRASADQAFARLGSSEKKLAWIEGAAHVITVDFGYERVFELTADWLESHSTSRPTFGRGRPDSLRGP